MGACLALLYLPSIIHTQLQHHAVVDPIAEKHMRTRISSGCAHERGGINGRLPAFVSQVLVPRWCHLTGREHGTHTIEPCAMPHFLLILPRLHDRGPRERIYCPTILHPFRHQRVLQPTFFQPRCPELREVIAARVRLRWDRRLVSSFGMFSPRFTQSPAGQLGRRRSCRHASICIRGFNPRSFGRSSSLLGGRGGVGGPPQLAPRWERGRRGLPQLAPRQHGHKQGPGHGGPQKLPGIAPGSVSCFACSGR